MIDDEQLKDAICNNDIDFLKEHRHDFDINHRFSDEDNDTLLSYAISDSDSELYYYLLNEGADIHLKNDEGENILHSAIYSGRIDRVKLVLNEDNIDEETRDGTTPLILALGLEHEDIASFLIDKDANIDCSDRDGNYPIHLAASLGLKSIVIKLISKRVYLNVKTKLGNLPISLAANNGHADIVKILYKLMYES